MNTFFSEQDIKRIEAEQGRPLTDRARQIVELCNQAYRRGLEDAAAQLPQEARTSL